MTSAGSSSARITFCLDSTALPSPRYFSCRRSYPPPIFPLLKGERRRTLYLSGERGGGNSACEKSTRREHPPARGGDCRIKKRARPRPTEAPSVRPSLFGFARPAGPDHGPKEDSTVKIKTLYLFNNMPQGLQNGLLGIAAQGVEFSRRAMTDESVADT